jgi:hypothetical protein
VTTAISLLGTAAWAARRELLQENECENYVDGGVDLAYVWKVPPEAIPPRRRYPMILPLELSVVIVL